MTISDPAVLEPTGFGHVRLTVTDIARSKAFYQSLFGAEPDVDFSDKVDEPGVLEDPEQLYGGCVFSVGGSMLGLRPVAPHDDTFKSTRVGLDHVSFKLPSPDAVRDAVKALDDAGIEHGRLNELSDFGMIIVSVQDPDDINLEICAELN